jgi:hypothetical protein
MDQDGLPTQCLGLRDEDDSAPVTAGSILSRMHKISRLCPSRRSFQVFYACAQFFSTRAANSQLLLHFCYPPRQGSTVCWTWQDTSFGGTHHLATKMAQLFFRDQNYVSSAIHFVCVYTLRLYTRYT